MDTRIKRVYQCEDSVDGIFTGIYNAWESRYGHRLIEIREVHSGEEFSNIELFTEYIDVAADSKKAAKVAESIRRKISDYAYEAVVKSALCSRKGKADAIYRFLQLGFHQGAKVMEQLSHPYVLPLFEMDRRVSSEVHNYHQFIRFRELENQILAARFRPENNIISLVAPHFADRFPEENWMLYDEGRRSAVFHRKGYSWILAEEQAFDLEQLNNYSDREESMQRFWKVFVDTIGIKERTNEKLQYNMLPNRYREFMNEVPFKSGK